MQTFADMRGVGVKNGLKWFKNYQKTFEDFFLNGGWGSKGGLAKDHTFSGFFFRLPSLTIS